MRTLVVGGANDVCYLADALVYKKHHVILINDDSGLCEKLAGRHKKSVVIHGDGTKLDVLKEAASGQIDLLFALSPSDAENYVICGLAKRALHVRETVAYTSNPYNAEALMQLGVDTVVDKIDSLVTAVEWVLFAGHGENSSMEI